MPARAAAASRRGAQDAVAQSVEEAQRAHAVTRVAPSCCNGKRALRCGYSARLSIGEKLQSGMRDYGRRARNTGCNVSRNMSRHENLKIEETARPVFRARQ